MTTTMLFTVLNVVALVGWAAVAFMTAMIWNDPAKPSAELLQLTLVCEVICVVDVLRIAAGNLRGDLTLAADVHYTRLMMCFVTIPHSEVSALVVKLILFAWSITEVTRYPMVLFPSSSVLKTIRYAVPLITFPLGAGTEAYAAYIVMKVASTDKVMKLALGLIVLINIFGGAAWYPSMVAKVVRSLGRGETKKRH
jgi:hypothetical protein